MTFLLLFLLFTVIPAFETWLLIQAGQVFGAWETVAWLLLMGVVGAWLGKRAGFGVLRDLQQDMAIGVSPADRLWEGALVAVGSVLLVTPGFLSDAVGALLFVGPVRRWLAPRLKRWVLARFTVRGVHVGPAGPGPSGPGPSARPARSGFRFNHPVA